MGPPPQGNCPACPCVNQALKPVTVSNLLYTLAGWPRKFWGPRIQPAKPIEKSGTESLLCRTNNSNVNKKIWLTVWSTEMKQRFSFGWIVVLFGQIAILFERFAILFGRIAISYYLKKNLSLESKIVLHFVWNIIYQKGWFW